MNNCYITSTGSFLPGEPIKNKNIANYLGATLGESKVKEKILKVNGIQTRHYALDENQNATHSAYELAAKAVENCLPPATNSEISPESKVEYLSAGTTNAPLIAPGITSLLHDELNKQGIINHAVEINSNSGICSSGAQAFVNASRSVKSGDVEKAVCVGVEQPSVILKSKAFRPSYDVATIFKNVRTSKWFMSTFLRFMLSDGAGAFLLEQEPSQEGHSLRIDWTYSRSFANEAPLCMKLSRKPSPILSQDINILSEHMPRLSEKAVEEALAKHDETLANYTAILPHMSSYYFEKTVTKIVAKLSPYKEVKHWTNLRTAGNTGAASIYIMLDEYMKTQPVHKGDKLLLFVPESGQFNFVLMSLTVV